MPHPTPLPRAPATVDPPVRRPQPPGSRGSARPAPARLVRPAAPPPPAVIRGRAEPVAPYSLRARLAAWGLLAAMVAAVALIFATTHATKPVNPLVVRTHAASRYWIVRSGQTLSTIAARESLGLGEIERLNPRLVPSTLVAGQRVRLP